MTILAIDGYVLAGTSGNIIGGVALLGTLATLGLVLRQRRRETRQAQATSND